MAQVALLLPSRVSSLTLKLRFTVMSTCLLSERYGYAYLPPCRHAGLLLIDIHRPPIQNDHVNVRFPSQTTAIDHAKPANTVHRNEYSLRPDPNRARSVGARQIRTMRGKDGCHKGGTDLWHVPTMRSVYDVARHTCHVCPGSRTFK